MDIFTPGEHIESSYRVQDVRKNGACMLYFCHDELFDRPVAIKTPRYDSVEELTNLVESFVQGAKRWILAGSEMETVEAYTLFRVLIDDDLKVPYLAMEFIKGDLRSGAHYWAGLMIQGLIFNSHCTLRIRSVRE